MDAREDHENKERKPVREVEFAVFGIDIFELLMAVICAETQAVFRDEGAIGNGINAEEVPMQAGRMVSAHAVN